MEEKRDFGVGLRALFILDALGRVHWDGFEDRVFMIFCGFGSLVGAAN